MRPTTPARDPRRRPISLILAEAIELGVVNPTPAMNPETWPGLTFLQMYDQYYGWGLIDIRASLCALRTLAGQPCP